MEKFLKESMDYLAREDEQVGAWLRREYQRQQENIELIASENITSPAVMAAVGSCLTNKYAEGYPGRRYYGGCEFVDEIETLAIDRAKALFGAEYANVQPHSGAQANLAAYAALMQPGDTLVGMDLAGGGHLTHGAAVNQSGKLYRAVSYGVDEKTGRIDYDRVEDIVRAARPRVLVAGASAYPRALDFKAFADIAHRHGAVVIEDAAESMGATYEGRQTGTFGDIAAISFNGNKIITTGAGGMVVSNHADWLERAKHLSTQAKADELQFVHDEVGYNYRLTNLQAALGLAQLEQLEGFIAHKNEMYDFYKERLDGKNGYRILPFRDGVRSNKWFYSLYLEDARHTRDGVIAALKAQNIQTRPVWALIHEQADYGRNETYGLAMAEDFRAKIVNLPCSTNLTREDAQRVVDALLAL